MKYLISTDVKDETPTQWISTAKDKKKIIISYFADPSELALNFTTIQHGCAHETVHERKNSSSQEMSHTCKLTFRLSTKGFQYKLIK